MSVVGTDWPVGFTRPARLRARVDCEAFFERVETHLGGRYERPDRTTSGGQCVVDFFHPRTLDAFGDGLAGSFNRSGVVWVPAAARLGVQLRVPEAHGDAVAGALAGAPFAFDRTDHRGVSRPDGEMVTVLHFSTRASGASPAAVDRTLAAVGAALSV